MTPVVFIHAFPLDARMWDEQIAALEGETTVLAPNLPGFGGTDLPEDILTVEVMADAVAAAMTDAGIDRAVVAGCSMGGYAAFELWRKHPERIAALCLLDTRAEPDDDAGKEKRAGLAATLRAEGNVLVDSPPPLLSDGAPQEIRDRVRSWISDQPAEAIARASLGMAARPDSIPTLTEISVPTSVIVGSEDALTPPPFSHTMAEAIPGAELVELQGAGHLAHLEDPQGFIDALRALIAKTA